MDGKINERPGVHSSVIARGSFKMGDHVSIGEGTTVGQGAVFGDSVRIGKNVFIGDGVKIKNCVTIGDNCRVDSGSSLGNGVVIGLQSHLGQNNRLGEGVVVGNWVTTFNHVTLKDFSAVRENTQLRNNVTLDIGCAIDSYQYVPTHANISRIDGYSHASGVTDVMVVIDERNLVTLYKVKGTWFAETPKNQPTTLADMPGDLENSLICKALLMVDTKPQYEFKEKSLFRRLFGVNKKC